MGTEQIQTPVYTETKKTKKNLTQFVSFKPTNTKNESNYYYKKPKKTKSTA